MAEINYKGLVFGQVSSYRGAERLGMERRFLPVWYGLGVTWAAILGAALTGLAYHGITWESTGTLVLALATVALAGFTAQSVAATRTMVDGESARHRADNTIRLMNDYTQTVMYASERAIFTPHVAASKLIKYAEDPENVFKLKGESEKEVDDESLSEKGKLQRTNAKREYPNLCNCVVIFDNFFFVGYNQFAKNVLDDALFKNTFARSYLETRGALDKIQHLLDVKLGNEEIHETLKVVFEEHLQHFQESRASQRAAMGATP